MNYFNHDTTAGSDDGIVALRLDKGNEAIAVYWELLEKMYRDECPITLDENQAETKAVCFRLGLGFKVVSEYVLAMISAGLFELVNDAPLTVVSSRAMENIEQYHEKAETARQNGKKGGRPKRKKTQRKPNPNPALTTLKANKIKENKIKGIGFDKQNQIPSVPSVTAAEGTAPDKTAEQTAVPCCPNCGSTDLAGMPLNPKCEKCGQHISLSDVRYVDVVA